MQEDILVSRLWCLKRARRFPRMKCKKVCLDFTVRLVQIRVSSRTPVVAANYFMDKGAPYSLAKIMTVISASEAH